MLVIEKFPEANTRAVTKAVEDALNQMRPGLSGIQIDTSLYRPAHVPADGAAQSRLVGAGRPAARRSALLTGFTLSWRTALTSLVALLCSLVTAALVLYLRGATFNLMVLAGFAIALAIVIDDAVVGRRRDPAAAAGAS